MKKSVLVIAAAAFIAAGTFISCTTTKDVAKITTDWIEQEIYDQDNCGYFVTSSEIGQVDMIEGEFKKATGYEKSAYGFIFGYPFSADGKVSNYIRLEINTDGQYALYKCEDGKYTDLVNNDVEGNTAYFNDCDAIVKGYDSTNKLKIELVDGKYNAYVNGTQVGSNITRLKNGLYGVMAFFSVGDKNQEKLPDEVVKVTYRITDGTVHTLTADEQKVVNNLKAAATTRTPVPEK